MNTTKPLDSERGQQQRQFPVHPSDRHLLASIPWEVLAPHAQQAYSNHSQSLERLAERGGMGLQEIWAVMHDQDVYPLSKLPSEEECLTYCKSLCEPPHRSEVAPEPSELGKFWMAWFDAVGEHATMDVINATAKLVLAEREIAVRDATRDGIAHASAEAEIRRQALEEAAREGDRFIEKVKGRGDERSDGAFVAITRLVRSIRQIASNVTGDGVYFDCAMCGAPRSFIIDPNNESVGYCFVEEQRWEISAGPRALASSAPSQPNASAIQTIENQRDEWQTKGWTTHVFAANELLKLLGTLANQLNFQA